MPEEKQPAIVIKMAEMREEIAAKSAKTEPSDEIAKAPEARIFVEAITGIDDDQWRLHIRFEGERPALSPNQSYRVVFLPV